MAFDPTTLSDDECTSGHLDEDPLHQLVLTLQAAQSTGRLTIEDERGPNHTFFMRGQPVGVQLSTPVYPLGQLLLELRDVDSSIYMRAQRVIVHQKRMPGQVFIELGAIDDARLREVLAIQSRRRFERFAVLKQRAFQFCAGLSFLTGFQRNQLSSNVLLYLAQQGHLQAGLLNDWLDALQSHEVRARGGSALPTPAETYAFGPPERRFIERIEHDWQSVGDLLETGTLNRPEAALILYHLDKLGRLERRVPPPAQPPPILRPSAQPAPVPAAALGEFDEQTPVFAEAPASVPDVFASPAPVDDMAAEADGFMNAMTEPGLKTKSANIHDVPTVLPGEPHALEAKAGPTPVRLKFPSENTLDKRPVKKKKKKKRTRRDEPEASVGSSAISRTKKEKTMIEPLPSIVIEDGDE